MFECITEQGETVLKAQSVEGEDDIGNGILEYSLNDDNNDYPRLVSLD